MGLLPQLGMLEIILLTAITLVVVGPKDLPRFLKGAGQFIAQLQNMAAEFKGTVDEMIRESELDEVRREITELAELDPHHELDKALEEFDELGRGIERDLEAGTGMHGKNTPAAMSDKSPAETHDATDMETSVDENTGATSPPAAETSPVTPPGN